MAVTCKKFKRRALCRTIVCDAGWTRSLKTKLFIRRNIVTRCVTRDAGPVIASSRKEKDGRHVQNRYARCWRLSDDGEHDQTVPVDNVRDENPERDHTRSCEWIICTSGLQRS